MKKSTVTPLTLLSENQRYQDELMLRLQPVEEEARAPIMEPTSSLQRRKSYYFLLNFGNAVKRVDHHSKIH